MSHQSIGPKESSRFGRSIPKRSTESHTPSTSQRSRLPPPRPRPNNHVSPLSYPPGKFSSSRKCSTDGHRICSVWKPLRNPVEDWPLAVCDGSNVDENDLLETDHIRRQYNGANMNAIYRQKYRWYYLHKQGPQEPLLLKQFDSASDVKAIRT